MQIKKTKKLEGGQTSYKLIEKIQLIFNKIIGIDPRRVFGPALHKKDRGIYLYINIVLCGHIMYQERKNADMVEW